MGTIDPIIARSLVKGMVTCSCPLVVYTTETDIICTDIVIVTVVGDTNTAALGAGVGMGTAVFVVTG
tara:strand:+ start:2089 stop:2289 length:201 start_codon:yes stop_codon:yes gene_type:complete